MNSFEANGIAALLPGIELVLAFVQTELDHMLDLVGHESANPPTPNMNQPHPSKQSLGGTRAWQNMSAKQKRARIAAMHRGRRLHAKKD